MGLTKLLILMAAAELSTHPGCTSPDAGKCGQDEKYVNEACLPCPKCPIGQGLNAPCGFGEGSRSECEPCPRGHFNSDHAGKRCFPCTDCDLHRREYRYKCRSMVNAECGKCMPGYYDSHADRLDPTALFPCSSCAWKPDAPECSNHSTNLPKGPSVTASDVSDPFTKGDDTKDCGPVCSLAVGLGTALGAVSLLCVFTTIILGGYSCVLRRAYKNLKRKLQAARWRCGWDSPDESALLPLTCGATIGQQCAQLSCPRPEEEANNNEQEQTKSQSRSVLRAPSGGMALQAGGILSATVSTEEPPAVFSTVGKNRCQEEHDKRHSFHWRHPDLPISSSPAEVVAKAHSAKQRACPCDMAPQRPSAPMLEEELVPETQTSSWFHGNGISFDRGSDVGNEGRSSVGETGDYHHGPPSDASTLYVRGPSSDFGTGRSPGDAMSINTVIPEESNGGQNQEISMRDGMPSDINLAPVHIVPSDASNAGSRASPIQPNMNGVHGSVGAVEGENHTAPASSFVDEAGGSVLERPPEGDSGADASERTSFSTPTHAQSRSQRNQSTQSQQAEYHPENGNGQAERNSPQFVFNGPTMFRVGNLQIGQHQTMENLVHGDHMDETRYPHKKRPVKKRSPRVRRKTAAEEHEEEEDENGGKERKTGEKQTTPSVDVVRQLLTCGMEEARMKNPVQESLKCQV